MYTQSRERCRVSFKMSVPSIVECSPNLSHSLRKSFFVLSSSLSLSLSQEVIICSIFQSHSLSSSLSQELVNFSLFQEVIICSISLSLMNILSLSQEGTVWSIFQFSLSIPEMSFSLSESNLFFLSLLQESLSLSHYGNDHLFYISVSLSLTKEMIICFIFQSLSFREVTIFSHRFPQKVISFFLSGSDHLFYPTFLPSFSVYISLSQEVIICLVFQSIFLSLKNLTLPQEVIIYSLFLSERHLFNLSVSFSLSGSGLLFSPCLSQEVIICSLQSLSLSLEVIIFAIFQFLSLSGSDHLFYLSFSLSFPLSQKWVIFLSFRPFSVSLMH
ncbi:unnamed protein product [Acanthosepion pharaonis]|uniref:Uncharacterized protein n=1 Tax=Acanthosepion pharaonis TaxID=158019 RepID=A0A812DPX0_ACAPH|nr:unnamed protein product [Sepia pharaonis]